MATLKKSLTSLHKISNLRSAKERESLRYQAQVSINISTMKFTLIYLGPVTAFLSLATAAPIPASLALQERAPAPSVRTAHGGGRHRRQSTTRDDWHGGLKWKRVPLGLQNGYHAELGDKVRRQAQV